MDQDSVTYPRVRQAIGLVHPPPHSAVIAIDLARERLKVCKII
jgi:hypothetical protein